MKIGNLMKSIAIVTATLFASLANAQDVELATNLGFEDPVGMQGEDTPDQWNPLRGVWSRRRHQYHRSFGRSNSCSDDN